MSKVENRVQKRHTPYLGSNPHVRDKRGRRRDTKSQRDKAPTVFECSRLSLPQRSEFEDISEMPWMTQPSASLLVTSYNA